MKRSLRRLETPALERSVEKPGSRTGRPNSGAPDDCMRIARSGWRIGGEPYCKRIERAGSGPIYVFSGKPGCKRIARSGWPKSGAIHRKGMAQSGWLNSGHPDCKRIARAREVQVFFLAMLATFMLAPAAVACPCEKYDKKAEEPKYVSMQEGMKFSKSAQYKKEFAECMASARKACLDYIKEHPGANDMAIVSDIDETVLDNRECFKDSDEFVWDEFLKWVEKAKAPPLKLSADFIKWARKKGFAIFFVTGRPENLKAQTIKNLVHANIAYDGIYFRAKGDRRSAIEVKTAVRRQIEDMGFRIVVNMGDQVSDMIGSHAIDCEKLPNKLYFVD